MFRSTFCRAILGDFQWYRRWYGGVWELWWVDYPVCTAVWHDVPEPTGRGPRPTPLCRGTPVVEDYRR